MYIIQCGLQPKENSVWNVENLAGLQPILMQDRTVKENMSHNPIYFLNRAPTREELNVKATFHSTIFDIPMRPLREDQRHRRRFTR